MRPCGISKLIKVARCQTDVHTKRKIMKHWSDAYLDDITLNSIDCLIQN